MEDNEINQQVAVELLQDVGAAVEVAANGRIAVEKLTALKGDSLFDLVLMDVQMPEMDGYQATARIRSEARFAALPIVAMTAHATVEERNRCLAAGMDDHVAKPIDPDILFDALLRHGKRRLPGTAAAREAVPDHAAANAAGQPAATPGTSRWSTVSTLPTASDGLPGTPSSSPR